MSQMDAGDRAARKHSVLGLVVVALVGAWGACTSHPLVRSARPDAEIVNPPPVPDDGALPADALPDTHLTEPPQDAPLDAPPDSDTRPPLPGEDAADGGTDRLATGPDLADGGTERPPTGPDTADAATERNDAGGDRVSDGGADGGLALLSWIQSVGGTPIRVLKRDRYVFLGDWESNAPSDAGVLGQAGSVQTYDVSDPLLPALRSALFTPPDQIQDLAIDGQWLFAANDALGLRLVDISQPEALRSVTNRVNGSLYATSVAVTHRGTDGGQQLYALAGYLYGGGLDIHAVPDGGPIPNPVHYTSAALTSRCDVYQIQVRDDRAYLLAGDGGTTECIEVLDISRLPAVPTVLGRLCLPFASYGALGDLRLSGDLLYFSAGDHSTHGGGLRIISVQDPTQPTLVGSLDLLPSAGAIPWKGTGLAVAGNEVFFLTASGVQVIDVSAPARPVLRTFAPFPTAFGTCQGGTAVAEADILYVGAYCRPAAGQGGLAIYRRR